MYNVEWLQSALDELADMWNRATSSECQAITAASHQAEQRLQRDPHAEGESRSGGTRIVFVPPLAISYRVEPDDQTVSILGVRRLRFGQP